MPNLPQTSDSATKTSRLKVVPTARTTAADESIPYDPIAEGLILGNVLFDADPTMVDRITPDLFFLEKHRLICQAARSLRERNVVIDPYTVSSELTKLGMLEAAGGMAAIAGCSEGVPRISNWQGYLDRLIDMANLRWLASATGDIQSQTLERGANFLQLAPDFAAQINKRIRDGSPLLEGVDMASVVERKTVWLVPNFIPLGTVSLWDGDGGAGKSTVSLALAVAIVQGFGFPHQTGSKEAPGDRGRVLILQTEDSVSETVKSRLRKLGSDGTDIRVITDRRANLTSAGLARLEATILDYKPRLVIIDPLLQYVGGKVDAYRPNEMREIMIELQRIAEEQGIAILLIRHFTKGESINPGKRGLGSVDILNSTRSHSILGFDHENKTERAIIHCKNTSGPLVKPIGYRIDDKGYLTWTGDSDLTSARILSDPEPEDKQLARAKRLLREYLAEGPRLSRDVVNYADDEHGIAKATLYRAKDLLGVEVVDAQLPRGKGRSPVYWALPKADAPPPDTEIMD